MHHAARIPFGRVSEPVNSESRMPLAGEVVFLRIFDLGGTLDLNRARKNLGDMAQLSRVQPTKAAPEYMSFAAPVPIDLSSLNLELTDEDGKPASISARLY